METALLVGPFDTWEELLVPAFFGLFLAVGLWGLAAAVRQLWRGVTILRSDPIDAGSVYLADGPVELEGEVEAIEGERLTTRYTNTECVAHEYEKQERERRRDADGNVEYEWETVDSGEDAVPFYVRDATGAVPVDPEGAELSLDSDRVSSSSGVRKYEGLLAPGDVVHVYGQKRDAIEGHETIDGEDTFVGDGDAVTDLMISDTTEMRTVVRYALSGTGRLVLFVGWTAIAGFLFLQTLAAGAYGTEVGVALDGIVESIRSLLP